MGYYGGDSVQSEDTGRLTPKMEIINKERLLLKVTCDTPRDPLHFYVTVTDAQGRHHRADGAHRLRSQRLLPHLIPSPWCWTT